MFVVEWLARVFFAFPLLIVLIGVALWSFVASLRRIGPTEVGLVTKRFSFRKLAKDNPVALDGEAGYQADLLMPGLRWKPFFLYSVEKYAWVQVPAGEIGVGGFQGGGSPRVGAKGGTV